MGYGSSIGMIEAADMLGLSKRAILEWHVLENHFPRPPYTVVDIAEEAIEKALKGELHEIINFSDFDIRFGDKSMLVCDIMDKLHLWQLVAEYDEE